MCSHSNGLSPMNEFLLIAFLLVSRTENERFGTIISTGSGQKQMCVVAAASDAIPAYLCPAPPAAPADSLPHTGDLLTLNSHMKQYSTRLAGFPQAFPKTFCPPEYSNKDMVWT